MSTDALQACVMKKVFMYFTVFPQHFKDWTHQTPTFQETNMGILLRRRNVPEESCSEKFFEGEMFQKKVAVKSSSKEKCSRRKLQWKILRRRNAPEESCSEKFFEGEMFQKKVAVQSSSKEKCSKRKLQWKIFRRRNVPEENCSEKFFEGEMFQKKVALKNSSKEKCSRRKLQWKILRRRNVPEKLQYKVLRRRNVPKESCSAKFFEGEMFQKKVAVKKTLFVFNNFFSRRSCRLWDNAEHYGTANQATNDNLIRRLRFTCWTVEG